jgi:CDP-diacylglycerol--glycerol-3-phosphate 3-phosphatidyltransferase
MTWNVPNILTVLRLVAAPCVALVFLIAERPLADWIAFWVFATAAITDFFDGYIARRFSQESLVGKMLDPIADKAMVVIALAVLMSLNGLAAWLVIPTMVILLREVLISGLREFLGDVKLDVTQLAKFKTTIQMMAIGLLFLVQPAFERASATGWLVEWIGVLLLWVAAILTAITGWDYMAKGLSHMREQEKR